MLLRPEYLSQKLDRPLPTKDGGTIATIGQAVDYMTSIGRKRELRSQWQRVRRIGGRAVKGLRKRKVCGRPRPRLRIEFTGNG